MCGRSAKPVSVVLLRRGSLPPFRLLSTPTLRGYAAASRASSAPAGSFTVARMSVSGAVPVMYTANGVYGEWGLHSQPKWEKGVHNCTFRRGPGTTGTPSCHAGTRSLRSDQPRSVSGLPRGRTYPTVRNLTIVASHVGWVPTEPVPREPGTARTEVESPAREEERGLLSSTSVPLAGPRSWTDLSKKPKSLPYPRNGTPPRVLSLTSLKRQCTLGLAGRSPSACTGWRLTLATAQVTSPDRKRRGLAAQGEVTSQRRATGPPEGAGDPTTKDE